MNEIRNYLRNVSNLMVELLPRELNTLAGQLAAHGQSSPKLSLYHQGPDVSQWLMETCSFRFVRLRLFLSIVLFSGPLTLILCSTYFVALLTKKKKILIV